MSATEGADTGSAAAQRWPNPSAENLTSLARLAWQLSARHCAGCRNYHVMWPYLRAIGANGSGPEFRWELQRNALAEALAGRTAIRWLIAGSADAGLLALAAAVMERHPGVPFSVTIIDRCQTPLGLCRAHADANDIDLTAIHADLDEFEPDQPFDIVVMHHTIVFFEPDHQTVLLKRVAGWLAPEGRLYLTFSHDPPDLHGPVTPSSTIRDWRERQVRDAAATGEAVPPEDLDAFVARLHTIRDGIRGPDQRRALGFYDELVAAAGMEVERILPLPKLPTDPVPGWRPRARAGLLARSARSSGG